MRPEGADVGQEANRAPDGLNSTQGGGVQVAGEGVNAGGCVKFSVS